MANQLFGNINSLERGLDAAWLRNQVISNNIANVDTPNFKSSNVEFESVFKAALGSEDFTAKCTNDKHISFSSMIDNATPVITENSNTTMRTDGNNVDIDYENTELAKNAIYYETLTEKISSEFARLKMAISEGK